MRYSSSLLRQLIDSISPYMTQIIVKGKSLTVGTSGVVCQEFDTPCSPQEIYTALYTKVQPVNSTCVQRINRFGYRCSPTTSSAP